MGDQPIISLKEARKILGKDADTLSDQELLEIIKSLHLLAKDSLQQAREKILMKRDAKYLAELIYDCYQDKKNKDKTVSNDKQEPTALEGAQN